MGSDKVVHELSKKWNKTHLKQQKIQLGKISYYSDNDIKKIEAIESVWL